MAESGADKELLRLNEILQGNSDKDFVKRILSPNAYPVLDLGNGRHASHLMSWGSVGNKYIVFPSVVHEPKTRRMTMMSGRDALDRAVATGEYVEFDNPTDAEWFSKSYKKVWGE